MTDTCKHGHYLSCSQCDEERRALKAQAEPEPPPRHPMTAREWRAARARARMAKS